MVELVYPSEQYKDSFIRAVKEFVAFKDTFFGQLKRFSSFDDNRLENDFYEYIIRPTEDERNGIGLAEGQVAHTVLWGVENGEFISRIDIRHELNDTLQNFGGHIAYAVRPTRRGHGYAKESVRLALAYAREKLNISTALMTADYRNEASVKTIVGLLKEYGGTLDVPYLKDDGSVNLRFWIKTKK